MQEWNTGSSLVRNPNSLLDPSFSLNFDNYGNQAMKADEWIGGFRISRAKRSYNSKPNIISQAKYNLFTVNGNRSALGFIAQFLKRNIQRIKQKNDAKP